MVQPGIWWQPGYCPDRLVGEQAESFQEEAALERGLESLRMKQEQVGMSGGRKEQPVLSEWRVEEHLHSQAAQKAAENQGAPHISDWGGQRERLKGQRPDAAGEGYEARR